MKRLISLLVLAGCTSTPDYKHDQEPEYTKFVISCVLNGGMASECICAYEYKDLNRHKVVEKCRNPLRDKPNVTVIPEPKPKIEKRLLSNRHHFRFGSH